MLNSTASGRFPRARLQPLPSLRSVQGLQLVLFPQESPLHTRQLKKMFDVSKRVGNHFDFQPFCLHSEVLYKLSTLFRIKTRKLEIVNRSYPIML